MAGELSSGPHGLLLVLLPEENPQDEPLLDLVLPLQISKSFRPNADCPTLRTRLVSTSSVLTHYQWEPGNVCYNYLPYVCRKYLQCRNSVGSRGAAQVLARLDLNCILLGSGLEQSHIIS